MTAKLFLIKVCLVSIFHATPSAKVVWNWHRWPSNAASLEPFTAIVCSWMRLQGPWPKRLASWDWGQAGSEVQHTSGLLVEEQLRNGPPFPPLSLSNAEESPGLSFVQTQAKSSITGTERRFYLRSWCGKPEGEKKEKNFSPYESKLNDVCWLMLAHLILYSVIHKEQ